MGLMAPEANTGPPPDRRTLQFVKLSSIHSNFIGSKASLRCWMTGRFYELREEGGLDAFDVVDTNGQVVLRGKVKAIQDRQVVFMADDKYYILQMGESLQEAKEATLADLKALGLDLTAKAEGQ
jgi:hypothetical protein